MTYLNELNIIMELLLRNGASDKELDVFNKQHLKQACTSMKDQVVVESKINRKESLSQHLVRTEQSMFDI